MNQKVMQNNFKKEHKVDQRSKNISMKQNNGSLKKARKFQVKNKGNRQKSTTLNGTLKVRQKKSNFWGAFIMKLTYEDKVQIYELRKHGQTFNQLSKRFGVDASGLRYMTRLIERYGIEIIKKGKNRYDSPELKQEMIDKVLLEDRSQQSVSLDYCLPSGGMLPNWIAQYKKMGIQFLRK